MKKLFLILLISLGINSFAQNKQKTYRDSTLETTSEFSYDTITFVVVNKYGLNEDPNKPGTYDDLYDTLYVQRQKSLNYFPSNVKNPTKYKLINK